MFWKTSGSAYVHIVNLSVPPPPFSAIKPTSNTEGIYTQDDDICIIPASFMLLHWIKILRVVEWVALIRFLFGV